LRKGEDAALATFTTVVIIVGQVSFAARGIFKVTISEKIVTACQRTQPLLTGSGCVVEGAGESFPDGHESAPIWLATLGGQTGVFIGDEGFTIVRLHRNPGAAGTIAVADGIGGARQFIVTESADLHGERDACTRHRVASWVADPTFAGIFLPNRRAVLTLTGAGPGQTLVGDSAGIIVVA
jgi:hypothetical protein